MHVATHLGQRLSLPWKAAPEEQRAGQAELEEARTDERTDDLVRDLSAKYGLSTDRARMLIDRFGFGRRRLAGAAQDLQEWSR